MSTITDPVRAYLTEIGRIKMLTVEEEIKLARQIKELLKLEAKAVELYNQLDRRPALSEWASSIGISCEQLNRCLYLGRKAKNEMVRANLRLVVSVAKKYIGRGLSLLDLIQEGSLGLIRAAEKFDPDKGYKFSTYATWWIRQACSRAVYEQSRTIRLPIHIWEKLNKIKQTTKRLHQQLGRNPTEVEIANAMSLSLSQLRFIARSTRAVDSTNRNVGEDEDTQLGDLIAAPDEPLEVKIEQNLLKSDIDRMLQSLTPKEAEIIRLRYGIIDGREKTLVEIGNKFNLTRERIRQIEVKALRKLRHANLTKLFREYTV